MRIPNWLAALGTIVLCVNMAIIALEDYQDGRIWWSTADAIVSSLWFIFAIFITWRAIRRPNATYGRLWNKK